MSSNCFEDGNNGQNTRTCATADGGGGSSGRGSSAEKGVMLFGVRLTTEGSFRKTVSMNNLCQYDHQPQDSNADAGYASDDVVHASGRSRERKRGIPWTEEEHKLFLLGLQKVGKGDWRGISRNYVKTRTPTQVASHAQKYFLRRSNQNRRRRSRNSLFDITTDTLMGSPMEEDQTHHMSVAVPQREPPQPPPHLTQPLTRNISGYYPASTYPAALLPVTAESSKDNLLLGQRVNQQTAPFHPRVVRPVPMLPVPPSSRISDLNLNQKPPSKAKVEPNLPLSLNLSSPSSSDDQPPTSSSAFQAMSSGDSIISVA